MAKPKIHPRVTAHRGFAGAFPENTLESVMAALALGARWVEIDVQLTKDGVPVVFHDSATARACGVRGDLREMTLAQARRLSVYEPGRFGPRFKNKVRLCTLAELAKAFAGHQARLFVELKTESMRRFGRLKLLAAVDEALAPLRKQCVLISFDEDVLRLARLGTEYPLGLVLTRRGQAHGDFKKTVRPEYIFSSTRLLAKKGRLKIPGSRLCVYEVPDPKLGLGLMRRGVDLIETFAIDRYLA